MKPHKHAELIKAWADGAEIQVYNSAHDEWRDIDENGPFWHEFTQYRIKPKQEPEPEKGYMYLNWQDGQNEWFITAAPFKCTKFKFKVETM